MTIRTLGRFAVPSMVLAGACSEHGLEQGGFVMPPPTVDFELSNDYYGTRFWAATTSNPELPEAFAEDFGVIVANPHASTATVSVRRGKEIVATGQVPAGASRTFLLPMNLDLSTVFTESVVVREAAYELESNIPVAVYQFNPMHFETDSEFSYTNDASLLIPEQALGAEYLASSFPSDPSVMGFPTGFVAVIGTQDGTHVEFAATAATLGGDVPPAAQGDLLQVELNAGDVLQVQAASLWDVDLTGSAISADRPVAVIGGHSCANVPMGAFACDHLEEMLPPTSSWGTLYGMLAPAHPTYDIAAPALYRIQAKEADTEIQFFPAVHEPAVLGTGEVLEFLSDQDFVIQSDEPILPVQFLLGTTYLHEFSAEETGDPSMLLGTPLSGGRDQYVLLVPDTYEQNWLAIFAPSGVEVRVDGAVVSLEPLGAGTEYASARVPVGGGTHRVESTGGEPFTVASYGYAAFTSYAYPAGRNYLTDEVSP